MGKSFKPNLLWNINVKDNVKLEPELGTNFSKVQNIFSLNNFVLHIFICC